MKPSEQHTHRAAEIAAEIANTGIDPKPYAADIHSLAYNGFASLIAVMPVVVGRQTLLVLRGQFDAPYLDLSDPGRPCTRREIQDWVLRRRHVYIWMPTHERRWERLKFPALARRILRPAPSFEDIVARVRDTFATTKVVIRDHRDAHLIVPPTRKPVATD